MVDGAPLFIGVLCGATIIALCGAILGLGLQGDFAGEASQAVVANAGISGQQADVFGSTNGSPVTPVAEPAATEPAPTQPVTETRSEVPVTLPAATDGVCQFDISPQERVYQHAWCAELPQTQSPIWGDPRFPACYPPGVPPWHPLGNIFVTMPDPAGCDIAVSETWNIAGWRMTYVQLTPGTVWTPPAQSPDAEYFIKIITGSVLNVGHSGILRDDGNWEMFVSGSECAG
jgi:hypothetical protein